jgi:hypothetical protein
MKLVISEKPEETPVSISLRTDGFGSVEVVAKKEKLEAVLVRITNHSGVAIIIGQTNTLAQMGFPVNSEKGSVKVY